MAKKRKTSTRTAVADEEKGWGSSKGGKMAPITTYEDVADSEDEFHINRDKVMLDDGPDAKRRKKWQEEGMWYLSLTVALLLTSIKMPSWNRPMKKS
jgi:U3 small nucleolar RNA-associated protein 3